MCKCPYCELDLIKKERRRYCKFCGVFVTDIEIYKKSVIDGTDKY